MNPDELYTRAALYEIAKRCPPLKHIDLSNASTTALRQLVNRHTSASIVQLPILATKLVTRMVCQFVSNRNPGFSEYIDYRTISVEVEPDELACLSKDDNFTNCSTNIYLIVFKNIATGFILSAVDRMRNRVQSSSANDGDTRIDPIRLPTHMTGAFADLNSRNLNVDPDKFRTFGDFGTKLNPLKRRLDTLDELQEQSKPKRLRTEGYVQQEGSEPLPEPSLSVSPTPTLDDATTEGVHRKQCESQQTPSECRHVTPDTRCSSGVPFVEGGTVDTSFVIADGKQDELQQRPSECRPPTPDTKRSPSLSFDDRDTTDTIMDVDLKQDESQQKPYEFRPVTPETGRSPSFAFDGDTISERSIVDSPISIHEDDAVIHLNSAEFVNGNVGVDSFFNQLNSASKNSISETEVNDSFYDEEQEEDDI